MIKTTKTPTKKMETDIKQFAQHKEDIKNAASEATKLIATAASDAAKVVSEAAAVAVRVISVKNADDHDLLIEMKTRMEGLKEDIRDLKSGMTEKLADHEVRLSKLETTKNTQTTLITIGTGILLVLVSIIIYHMLNTPLTIR